MSMEEVLAGLRAAAEPTRLRLLALCAQGEWTVTELVQVVGQSQPRVSRHLKLLCEARLLDRFREGSWVFHRLSQGEGGALARLLIDLLGQDDPVLAVDRERLTAVRRARSEAAGAYFRAHAADWDRIRSLYVPEREVERELLSLFAEGDCKSLLDIGTGTARILEVFAPRVGFGLGIDLSREMLSVARANLDRAGIRNCQVRQADMYHLPLPATSFDAVTIHQVLHFADDPQAVLAEAARVLRPGGRLAVVDFAPHRLEFLRDEHAHRRLGFADDEMAAWYRAAGLDPQEPRRLPGSPLTVVIWPACRRAVSGVHRQRTAERSAA